MIVSSRPSHEYGYRLRNHFNGEIIADRTFKTREEMEAALVEDLAPDKLLGQAFASIVGKDE